MPISIVTANVHLRSKSAMTQSRHYEVDWLEGEQPGDYDRRNWRCHLHVRRSAEGRDTVHIPGRAIHMALADAAKYSKRQIPGQGKATWTAKFNSGIAIPEDLDLGIDPLTVDYIEISANSDGKRGGGKRVPRRFPLIPSWEAQFTVMILDPIIKQDIFVEMLEIAGLFIGVGQYRPQNGGTNGRFDIVSVDWEANLRPVARRAA